MVSVADEIQIGADTGSAINAFNQLRQAADGAFDAIGLKGKAAERSMASVEKVIAQAAATSILQSKATSQATQASAAHAKAMQTEAQAAAKLAIEEKRVYEAMGLARNSAGRTVVADTGRFANKEQINLAKSYVRSLEEINAAEALLARTQAARAAAASRHNQTQIGLPAMTPASPIGSAAWVSAGQAAQMGLMAQNLAKIRAEIPPMLTLRGVLRDIPPVQWATSLGRGMDALLDMSNSGRYALYSVASGAAVAGAAIGGFGVLSIKAAIDHERAFANVARTTSTTAAGYEVLKRQLETMSMEIPVTYEELTKIATAAGQLGIQASGISEFTRTVAMLASTTNLSSDAAGNALARFKSFFSEVDGSDQSLAVTERTFSNLASSILKVGVNSIATESGIVNVSTQISSMGKYAGFTADQVIGLAGALSSVGVAPELARGITTRLFTIIGDSVSAGGVQLEKFAALSGVTAAEFKAAWGTQEFSGIFTGFLQGLNGIQQKGGDANQALRDLGITAVRDRPVWLRLASAAGETGVAGSLLAQTMADARAGWVQNTELAVQYTKISNTASARIQVMAQAFEQLFAAMGEESGSFVGEMAKNITGIVRGFEEFAQSDAGKVFGTIAAQGSLVVGAMLLVIGALAGTAATAQGVGQAFREMTAAGVGGATRLTTAFRLMSLAGGLLGIVTTIALMAGAFAAAGEASRKAALPVQDMGGLIEAMAVDAENGDKSLATFRATTSSVGEEAAQSAKTAGQMAEALYGVKQGGEGASGGIDKATESARKAKYVFGETAKEFYKSQLVMSEGFQNLFNEENFAGVGGLGDFNPVAIDWDRIMTESVREGGNVSKALQSEINKQLGTDFAFGDQIFDANEQALYEWSIAGANAFGSMSGDVQKYINANQALATESNATTNQMIDDYEQLEDAQKKTVDNMAAGFSKFTNSSDLIGLTQKFKEIFSQDPSETDPSMMAKQWETAWSDAFGGASFSAEEYLGTFRMAAQEQRTFVEGLQTLGSRGLSTAIIEDLAAMGPQAASLVEALVNGTDEQLAEYEQLWGDTGYDSMIRFATQAAIGQAIVNNIMATGGINALRAFNEQLAMGTGVDAALASLQRDVDGNPITPKANPISAIPPVPQNVKDNWVANNKLSIPVTPYLTKSNLQVDEGFSTSGSAKMRIFASGGYTGDGGKFEPKGVVHGGEFVMTKEATRRIGLSNLYAMMRGASAGRAAPKTKGYASGGFVGNGGSSGTMVVELSSRDRFLLERIGGDVNVNIGNEMVSRSTDSGNARLSQRGAG